MGDHSKAVYGNVDSNKEMQYYNLKSAYAPVGTAGKPWLLEVAPTHEGVSPGCNHVNDLGLAEMTFSIVTYTVEITFHFRLFNLSSS